MYPFVGSPNRGGEHASPADHFGSADFDDLVAERRGRRPRHGRARAVSGPAAVKDATMPRSRRSRRETEQETRRGGQQEQPEGDLEASLGERVRKPGAVRGGKA